ncbi:Ig-like domain-containing protein [Roseimarinus sediminis]|uniref:Ig-like domain-containing protein n=1 Tax=Roseimarinus sediminis TaxID=1610899 RepID=UPI003D1E1D9B
MRKFYLLTLTAVLSCLLGIPSMAQISAGDLEVLNTLYLETGGVDGKWNTSWSWDPNEESVIVDGSYSLPGVKLNALGFVTEIDVSGFGLQGALPSNFTPPDGVDALTKLKVINISNNPGLSGFISADFMKYLDNVEVLNISNVKVEGGLPDNINVLEKVTSINISSTGINELPTTIGDLPNLTSLNLSSNGITSLPASIYNLSKLSYLSLAYNKLSELPAAASTSTTTAMIDIRGNALDFCDIETFKQGFTNAVVLAAPQSLSLPKVVAHSSSIGETVSFEANVCGEGNSYQWYKADTKIEGATAAQLVLNNISKADAGIYRCVVSNSNAIGLTIESDKNVLVVLEDWAPDVTLTQVYEDVAKSFSLFNSFSSEQLSRLASVWEKNGSIALTIETQAENGIATVMDQNALYIRYMPDPDFFGNDEFVYKLTSGDEVNTGKVSFNVAAMNDKPVLTLLDQNDAPLSNPVFNVKYGETVSFKAVMDDSKDKDLASALEFKKVAASMGGEITYDPATQLATYQPKQNVNNTEIVVLMSSETGSNPLNSSQTIVRFNIEEVIQNTAPVANDFSTEVESGQVIRFNIPASDQESARSALQVKITAAPSNAAYFGWSGGVFTYKPRTDFTGSESFKFTVTDDKGAVSNEATVSINVTVPPVIELPAGQLSSYLDFRSVRYYNYYNTYVYYYRYARWYYRGRTYQYMGNTTQPSNVGYAIIAKRYANSYITVQYNPSVISAVRLYNGSIRVNYNYNFLYNLARSFGNGYNVVSYLDRYAGNFPIQVSHRDASTGRVIATQSLTLDANGGYTYYYNQMRYGGNRVYYYYGNEELNNPQEDLLAMEVDAFDTRFKSGFLEDPTPPEIPDSIMVEPTDSTIVEETDPFDNGGVAIAVSRDTVTVNYGEVTALSFLATSTSGQVNMEVVNQPGKGTLSDFAFSKFENEIKTTYAGNYEASANAEAVDSIVYKAFNDQDTVTQTKVIMIRKVKSPPTLAAIADQSINEDTELNIDLGIEDLDTPFDQLSIVTNVTASNNNFDVSVLDGNLKIVPPANFNGDALVEVNVIDPDEQQASASFTLSINPVNDAPVINVDSSYTIDYNQAFSLVVSASDTDGDELTFTALNVPAWLSFDAAGSLAGILSGTPLATDAGTYTLTLEASDGTTTAEQNFSITVNGPDVDTPPALTSPLLPVELDKAESTKTIDISTAFTDIDGDEISLSVTSNTNENWLSAQVTDGSLVLNVVDANYTGTAALTITAESNGLTTTALLSVFTTDNAPVVAGSLDNLDLWKNSEDISISLEGLVTDPDGDAITYSVASNSLPSMVSATVEGSTLTLSFAENKGGSAAIFIAGSAFGKSAEAGFIVNVKDAAPLLNTSVDAQVMYKNDSILVVDLENVFTDSDDPQVTVSLLELSKAGIIDVSIIENTAFITPVGTEYGTVEVTIQGKTNDKAVSHTFTVEVKDMAPKVNVPLEDQIIPKNSNAVEIDISTLFIDEDDPTVIASLLSLSDDTKATVSLSGNTLIVTPVAGMTGDFDITLRGTSAGKTIDYTFTVTLENKAPVVNEGPADQQVFKNSDALSFDLSNLFSDEDDDDLVISLGTVSNDDLIDASLNGNTLNISVAAGLSGSSEITILGVSGGDNISYTFTVEVQDRAPELISDIPAVQVNEDDAPFTITLSDYFSDPDGDALSYEVTSNTNTGLIVTSVSGGTLTLTFTADTYGVAELEITANAAGQSVKTTVSVDVKQKVGIDEATFGKQLSIYPNPVVDQLNIRWKGTSEISNVHFIVTDLAGRSVLKFHVDYLTPGQVTSIPMNEVSSGVYFLKVSSAQYGYNTQIVK